MADPEGTTEQLLTALQQQVLALLAQDNQARSTARVQDDLLVHTVYSTLTTLERRNLVTRVWTGGWLGMGSYGWMATYKGRDAASLPFGDQERP